MVTMPEGGIYREEIDRTLAVFMLDVTTPLFLDRPRIVYLAGPMSGYVGHNYPAFDLAEEALKKAGHAVFSPAKFDLGIWGKRPAADFPIRRAFSSYTDFICKRAEAVVVLPGWERSRGTLVEVSLASVLGIPIVEFAAWSEHTSETVRHVKYRLAFNPGGE